MSSTRYQRQPMQIYQDPISSDRAPMPPTQISASKTSSPLRPIKNVSSRRNIIFNPPTSSTSNTSPLKSAQQSSSSPSRAPLGSKLNTFSMPPPGGSNYQTDSLRKKQPLMSKFKTDPQKALFATYSNSSGKENYHPAIAPAPSPYDTLQQGNSAFDSVYGQKSENKRVLIEAAPIEDSRPAKKAKVELEPAISGTEHFPVLYDDGSKPAHSYAMLIGMAILRAPNRRLTLAQIYKWISDTYSYYNAADAGWQNSIRHNLSLNKAFVKQERPKDDPGKGNYWAIEAGKEKHFMKDKQSKKSAGINENIPIMETSVVPVASQEPLHSTYKSSAQAGQDLLPPSSSFMPTQPIQANGAELSSDATIPLSDAFVPEEEPEEDDFMARHATYPPIPSSPPAMMHSSPPVPRHVQIRENTPPPVPRFPTSSRSRSHRRNFASMDDSGYYSSLNSSVLRGPHERRLTSEADRPRIKRGRAEEEIARLRGSSYDSPTKARAFMTQSSTFVPPSSSPTRRGQAQDSFQMLPPLTPAVKLKPPMRPPKSVSPNTNLRLHRDRVRQLVGSPDRGVSYLDENLPWSPAFQLDPHIDDSSYIDFSTGLDIFADTNIDLLSVPSTGSPAKRSMRNSRMDPPRSSNILGDISNTNLNRDITSTPLVKFNASLAPSMLGSPWKGYSSASPIKFNSPSLIITDFDLPQEDFYGAEFLADELTEFSGMDILQGFQKIGAGNMKSNQTPKSTNSRPPLARNCFTSRF